MTELEGGKSIERVRRTEGGETEGQVNANKVLGRY